MWNRFVDFIKLKFKAKPQKPYRIPVTHNYLERYWGHDYSVVSSNESGTKANILGWGHGLIKGDFLLLKSKSSKSGRALYRIKEVSYFNDPKDMWDVKVEWEPSFTCLSCKTTFRADDLKGSECPRCKVNL